MIENSFDKKAFKKQLSTVQNLVEAKKPIAEEQFCSLGLTLLGTLRIADPRPYQNPPDPNWPSDGALQFFSLSLNDKADIEGRHSDKENSRYLTKGLASVGFYYAADLTLNQIGNISGVTREAVRLRIKDAVTALWSDSKESQEQFPDLSDLMVQMSRSAGSIQCRRSLSRSKGGLAIKVEQATREGLTRDQIRELHHLSPQQLDNALQTLKRWDLDTSALRILKSKSEREAEINQIKELLKSPHTRKRAGKLIREMGAYTFRELMANDDPVFIKLGEPILNAGLHYNKKKASKIAKILKKEGIDVFMRENTVNRDGVKSTIRYYFLDAADSALATSRILETISAKPELDKIFRNPVMQIAGPDYGSSLPTTTQLRDKTGFNSLGDIFKKINIRRRNYSDYLGTNCPSPVLVWKSAYFFPVQVEPELTRYVQERHWLFESGQITSK